MKKTFAEQDIFDADLIIKKINEINSIMFDSSLIEVNWEDFFNNQGKDYISDTSLGSLNQITIGSETKYINITEENIAEVIANWTGIPVNKITELL